MEHLKFFHVLPSCGEDRVVTTWDQLGSQILMQTVVIRQIDIIKNLKGIIRILEFNCWKEP